MLTIEQLKEELHYDPETGIFTRLKDKPNSPKGSEVGTLNKWGYLQTSIKNKKYLLHRLAWFYIYETFPNYTDHINMDKTDNRLCNLRACSNSQNMCNTTLQANNTSGAKGVCFDKAQQRYLAYVEIDGKRTSKSFVLTRYKSISECYTAACTWVEEMRINLHGEFARNY